MSIELTEFDKATIADSTQLIKAIIPYMDANMQRNISFFIRFIEMKQTINYYSHNIIQSDVASASLNNPGSLFKNPEIFTSIKKCCPESQLQFISTIESWLKMTDVINMYQNMEQNSQFQDIINMMNNSNNPPPKSEANTSTNNPFDVLKGYMNEEQMHEYDDYMNILNSKTFEGEDSSKL